MSGDLISREAIINILQKDLKTGDDTVTISWLKTWLEMQPTVDAEPVVHGRWLTLEEYAKKIGADPTPYEGGWRFCSECEQPMRDINGWLYCPSCGAKNE